MKKEAKTLLDKAIDSLILAVEHFNSPWDCGRRDAVLILLDHSFEMLLKAALVNKNQKIKEKRKNETYGFDKCVRVAIANKIITEDQALILQPINALRDAAQHYILELSEHHFYFHSQSGLTLFKDILNQNFGKDLASNMPKRVLPISTTPISDINTLFENELEEVKRLLKPGKRRKQEAIAILRGLAIFDRAIQGEVGQPSRSYLNKIIEKIKGGHKLPNVFSGIAAIAITADGTGPSVSLRFTKKEGIPIHTVPEGTPGAAIVALKRVNELDFYNLSTTQLAGKIGLTVPKTGALIWYMKLCENSEYFMEIKMGKTIFKRYSQKAIKAIEEKLPNTDMQVVWQKYKARRGDSI